MFNHKLGYFIGLLFMCYLEFTDSALLATPGPWIALLLLQSPQIAQELGKKWEEGRREVE